MAGVDILYYKSIASTNGEAYLLAMKDCADWTVVVAEEQSAGRGRKGKQWVSPKGGLWFSIVLRPSVSPGLVSVLQYFASNSARRVLEEYVAVGVKWPNDLMLGRLKVGGILVESRFVRNELSFAVVGIGINLNIPATSLPTGATSLQVSTGRQFDKEAVLENILKSLQLAYHDLSKPWAIFDEWWTHCVHRSGQVSIESPEGSIVGTCIGLDPKGRLRLRSPEGELLVSEGTLRVPE
ncbi:MAG TPA: biotin--[acetyl-CoA-carboxylase] ligase [Candidatus Binatus sp.]|nr:biotin--[acetyl-CoA-carboxylase] ligase [Candidatus Binatus sp.]